MNLDDKLAELKKYASENGFKLNPNEQFVKDFILVLDKLDGYCPCRKRTGVEEEDNKIKCPCIYHKSEISNKGFCHCRIFIK